MAPNPSSHVLAGLLRQKANKSGGDGKILLQPPLDKVIYHRMHLQSQPDAAHHVLHTLSFERELHALLPDV